MEVVLALKHNGSPDITALAFQAENGELAERPGHDGIPRQILPLLRSSPGIPILVFDQRKSLFLEELWNVLRPDQAWKGSAGDEDIEAWGRVLCELWQEGRQLGFALLQEIIPLLSPGDPLQDFLGAAGDNIILEMVPDRHDIPSREGQRQPGLQFVRDEVLEVLGPSGLMSRSMEAYCYRSEQESMAREVCLALEQEEFLLAEAGTGVGKTLAYLVPAIYWAAAAEQRVVVSTRTKALQAQLAEKDLPLLKASLPVSFTWRIAYGKDNYLCRARWQGLKQNPDDLSVEERRLLAGLSIWLARGGRGEFQELRWDGPAQALWKQVNCQRHGCGGSLCPWQNRCYFFTARKDLHHADLIVVNHALLLSDMAIGGHILPSYRHLIIDEAHNFDRTAFEKLGASFSVDEGLRLLTKLSEKRNGIERGYLASLKARYLQLSGELAQASRSVDIARQSINGLARSGIGTPGFSGSCRITPGMDGADELCFACREISGALREVESSLEELAELLADTGEAMDLAALVGEVRDTNNNLWLIGDSLDRGSEEEVVWIESDPHGLALIAAAPLDVGRELNQSLYPELKSLILVSATLTVGQSFEYIKGRLGLDGVDKDRIREHRSPSPFDFRRNCRTLAVTNLAEPGSLKYAESIARSVKTIARTAGKRTLVLFTAKTLLLQTARLLREEEPELAERLICQYLDGDYGTLIAKLAGRTDGILLGAETFWEGVDLPGDMLNCLVLTRLPFRPPSEPLAEAWIERLTRQGRNAFQEYSLAEAVIRFRQGVGRLIRSETDSGVVVILDRRFCLPPTGRKYSSLFRDSLPEQTVLEIGDGDLDREVSSWFADRK